MTTATTTAHQESFLAAAGPVLAAVVLPDHDPVVVQAEGGWASDLAPGSCVEVVIGRRLVPGYITAVGVGRGSGQVRTCPRAIPDAAIPPPVLALAEWAAGYYRCALGNVLDAVIPTSVRAGMRAAQVRLVRRGAGIHPGAIPSRQRAALERVLALLPEGEGRPITDLAAEAHTTAATIEALARTGALTATTMGTTVNVPMPVGRERHPPTAEQERVIAAIAADGPAIHLLHGVTGSGKTLVYLELALREIARGRRVLMLVPEIALTPQLAARIRTVIPRTLVLHSAWTDGERADLHRQVLAGEADLVLGPRSALFAPLRDLGLIIVDEEHEHTYKQADRQPRYHARDLAVVYAHQLRIPVILGSATPSAESWHNAQTGKYRYHRLSERPAGAQVPAVAVVDMRAVGAAGGRSPLSPPLIAALAAVRDAGDQAIVLLNRRGWSTVVVCRSCGAKVLCRRCDVGLAYHQEDATLRCHCCGWSQGMPTTCPTCGEAALARDGLGTEQLVPLLEGAVPGLRCLRLDADAAAKRQDGERILASFAAGEADCLVGTQMVAKGLNFPRVTLVGVVGADLGLCAPTFRAGERTFQLLAQVAGRAGRGQRPGRVILQAWDPAAPAVQAAVTADVAGFLAGEMALRREYGYPPYNALVRVWWTSPDRDRVEEGAQRQGAALAALAQEAGVVVLGPVPADPALLNGRWRWTALLKCPSRSAAQRLLDRAVDVVHGERQLAAILDIDPLA